MATNPYFNQMNNPHTKNFIQGLVDQAIAASGIDVFYLRRELVERDEVFDEAVKERFTQAIKIEMMVEDIMNFNGGGHNFFVGFTMEDSATFVFSQRRFVQTVEAQRPRDGDLIYIPSADMTFQVDKTLEDESWRQWGQNYVWRLRCSRFRFGYEDIDIEEDFDGVEEEIVGPNEDIVDDGVILPYDWTSAEAAERETKADDIDIDFGG